MKKVISLMLTVLLFLMITVTAISAETSNTVTVASIYANPGTQVSVPVTISAVDGIVAMSLDITYDTSALQLVSVTAKEGFFPTDSIITSQYLTDSPYFVNWDDSLNAAHSGEGNLLLLTFKVNDIAANGNYFVKAAVRDADTYNYDLNEVAFTSVDGAVIVTDGEITTAEITSGLTTEATTELTTPTTETTTQMTTQPTTVITTITTTQIPTTEPTTKITTEPTTVETTTEKIIIYGDANSDGYINAKDTLMMRQYIAEWSVTIDMTASDVNVDGNINTKDILRLKQYIAEWDVKLGKS